jgi:hypothetical protein
LTHALIGIGLQKGVLKLNEPPLLPEWRNDKNVQ